MPSRQYSGCEGLSDDGKLEKLRERFRQREGTTPKAGLELGSTEHYAERQRLKRDEARYSRSDDGRGGSCTG